MAFPEVIVRQETAHEAYVRTNLSDRSIGRIKVDYDSVNDRLAAVRKYRSDLGLEDGHVFIPMHDETIADAQAEWDEQRALWLKGECPGQQYGDARTEEAFIEYNGGRPDTRRGHTSFRPAYEGEPTHFQIYETVSEGTPTSPVFETKEEMIEWLTTDGGRDGPVSQEAADKFVEIGFVTSGMWSNGTFKAGIEAAADL